MLTEALHQSSCLNVQETQTYPSQRRHYALRIFLQPLEHSVLELSVTNTLDLSSERLDYNVLINVLTTMQCEHYPAPSPRKAMSITQPLINQENNGLACPYYKNNASQCHSRSCANGFQNINRMRYHNACFNIFSTLTLTA
jgi:hypothetical protein